MHNFEKRRDRYNGYTRFANPLINLSFELTVPDLRPYCKARQLPPFHVFLYCVLQAIEGIDNFMYRELDGEVIRIDDFMASYTVLNHDNNLNFARFDMSNDLALFIERSLAAKQVAEASTALINTSEGLSPLDHKRNVYITCMPWLQLSAIEHPIFLHKTADIPSLAWGKFGAERDGMMSLPFSVQAHHGFADGYHIYQLGEAIKERIARLIAPD